MKRQVIPIEKFHMRAFHLWDIQWLLLTSGDYFLGQFNAMTIGWGSIGYVWRRPFIQVLVRPHRYTFEFMETYDSFTVCAFPKRYHDALQLLGTRSGRDSNKISETHLTPIPSSRVAAPGYAQASLILECKKIYWDDLDPKHFLHLEIDKNYPKQDYHRIYFGEIVEILGNRSFMTGAD